MKRVLRESSLTVFGWQIAVTTGTVLRGYEYDTPIVTQGGCMYKAFDTESYFDVSRRGYHFCSINSDEQTARTEYW